MARPTHLEEQSQGGSELAIRDCQVQLVIFSSRKVIDNFDMLVIRWTIACWLGFQESRPCTVFCIIGNRTFVPISRMCKKQTAVSHSCSKGEIISLSAAFSSVQKHLGYSDRQWDDIKEPGACLWVHSVEESPSVPSSGGKTRQTSTKTPRLPER